MKFLKRTLKTGIALMLSMAVPAIAFATTDDPSGGTSEITQDLIELVIIAIKGLNMFLWPVLIMIGDLMDSDLIMGPGMDERLRELWVQVRNLVNMGFVLVLLAIAFYNVLGIGGGEGDLAMKTALPKLILGLVLVNFTLPIGRVLIDVTNVATHAAFGLPEVTGQFDFKETQDEFAQRMCYKKFDPTKDDAGNPNHVYWDSDNIDGQLYVQAFCESVPVEDSEGEGTEKKRFTGELNDFAKVNYFKELNANNLGLIMAVNNQSLTQVMQFNENKVTRWDDITVSLLFALVMYIIFAISYIALAVLLFTRIIVLWTALVLSPLGVLIYVVPQIKEWMGGGGDIQQKVIKHLMAPIIVGLTYSLGYMLILAWDQDGRGNLSAADAQLGELMTADFLLSGINDLTDMMIAMLSVVIIWVGVFAAAEGTIAQKATDAIKGFGEQIGGALAKAPLTIPTVPIGNPDDPSAKVSPLAVAKLANQGLYQLETGAVQSQTNKLFEGNPELGKWFGYGGSTGDPKDGANKIESAMSSLGTSSDISQEQLKKIATGLYDTVKGSDLSKDKTLMSKVSRLMNRESGKYTTQDLRDLQQVARRKDVTDVVKKTGIIGAEDATKRFGDNSSLKLKPKDEPAPAAEATPAPDDAAADAEASKVELPKITKDLPKHVIVGKTSNGGAVEIPMPKSIQAYKAKPSEDTLKKAQENIKTLKSHKAGTKVQAVITDSNGKETTGPYELTDDDIKSIESFISDLPEGLK